jgi:pimeloyl-ACP methyl ester carboxylesterase
MIRTKPTTTQRAPSLNPTSAPTTAPPTTRRRSRRMTWPRRVLLVLLILLIALLALAASGAIYQLGATAMDRRSHPAPGQLIDVDGSQLHLHCSGEGSPTVILEAAAAATSAHWSWVQPDVATGTRVCTYDRAGMGWSDPGPKPRDGHQIATELHTVLTRAGVPGPYVLVGHSFGGLYVRTYAAAYPGEVAGMVLVDATHPDLWKHLPTKLSTPPDQQPLGTFPILAGLGLVRLGLFDPFPVDSDLPAKQRAELAALHASTSSVATIADELGAFSATAAQVREAPHLGGTPLVVLTSEDAYVAYSGELDAQANRVWKDLQSELATLSSNSVHREIADTTHESLVNRERDAQATSAAIRHVIEAVRTGQPLVR